MSIFTSAPKVQKQPPATQLRVQTAVLGEVRTIIYGQSRIAGNLVDYVDFKSKTTKSSGGGKGSLGSGGKGSSGSGTTTYSVAAIIGLCEGPIASIDAVYENQSLTTLSAENLTAFLGSYAQSPWGYMTTNHSSRALNYHGLAYVAGVLALGSSPALPNLTFVLTGAYNNAISGKADANPKDVLYDLLTNSHYGINFPSAWIGDLSNFTNYCLAAGLVVSPAISSQTQLSSFIDDLMKATNCMLTFVGGKLTVVPYGDQALSANGYTYTPPSQALYSVGDSDWMDNTTETNGGPLLITRTAIADQQNSINIEFLDRAAAYNPDVVNAKDQALIETYGIREDSKVSLHMFCDRAAAQLSAALMLGRQSILNQYNFTLGREFILLDPGDIIEVNDSNLGLTNQWVRIVDITENTDGTLTINAEEYLAGTGGAPAYGSQGNSGAGLAFNEDPGNVTAVTIFDTAIEATDSGQLEVWVAACGGPAWGGYEAWISTDGVTYAFVERVEGASRMGVLTGTFASGSDPDTTNTLSVDLTESSGQLTGGSANDADTGVTDCWVDGEFVSYEQATLTSTYHYDLGKHGGSAGYLRRGRLGSQISSHSIGAAFVRLDGNVLSIAYDKSNVGTTFYIKFVSINVFGGGKQDISSLSPYTHTIGGPPTVYGASSLTATATGPRAITLTWNNAFNLGQSAIQIWRSTTSSFGGASHIADVPANGTSYVDANVTTGTQYWYWIRPVDLAGNAGNYSPSTGGAGATATAGSVQTGDIATAAVTTPTIAAQAVNNPGYVQNSGVNITGTASVIASFTLTTTGGSVEVLFTDNFTRPGGHTPVIVYTILRDGSAITPGLGFGGSGVAQNCAACGGILDSPSAGSHTYALQAQVTVDTGGGATVCNNPYLQVTEIKR